VGVRCRRCGQPYRPVAREHWFCAGCHFARWWWRSATDHAHLEPGERVYPDATPAPRAPSLFDQPGQEELVVATTSSGGEQA
jgi:hypothetical protein